MDDQKAKELENEERHRLAIAGLQTEIQKLTGTHVGVAVRGGVGCWVLVLARGVLS